MAELLVYAGLFSVSFLAATIFPAQSEAGLAALILSQHYSVVLLVLVASLGNILGAVVNWFLGLWLTRLQKFSWFPIKPQKLEKAEGWYRKYGRWSLLLSWVPFMGDPITIVAGVLREPIYSFLVLVSIAKITRYIAVAFIVLKLNEP